MPYDRFERYTDAFHSQNLKMSTHSECRYILVLLVTIFLVLKSPNGLSVAVENNFTEIVWKLTNIKDRYFWGTMSTHNVSSVKECAEKCTCDTLSKCKAFGINTSTMNCSLYDYLVWSGKSFIEASTQRYYWLVQNICPMNSGYVFNESNGICFKKYTNSLNWTSAMEVCGDDDGHLMIVDKPAKSEILKAFMPSIYKHAGSTDKGKEGEWRWLNGMPFDSPPWEPAQPNNYGGNQHCLTIHSANATFGDGECWRARPFICEIPMFV